MMNLYQAYNLFLYTGIMLLDNQLISTCPDYIEEKCYKFFGKLGKPEFIEYPKVKNELQREKNAITNEGDFWEKYCKIWKVDKDNFELMNVINFLLNIHPLFRKEQNRNMDLMFEQFKKYIGDLNIITEEKMKFAVHPILKEAIDRNINFDSRYLKLKIINETY